MPKATLLANGACRHHSGEQSAVHCAGVAAHAQTRHPAGECALHDGGQQSGLVDSLRSAGQSHDKEEQARDGASSDTADAREANRLQLTPHRLAGGILGGGRRREGVHQPVALFRAHPQV